jgi:hypothetical protein
MQFTQRPLRPQLEEALQQLQRMRLQEELLLRIILGAAQYEPVKGFEPSSFTAKIQSELQRRVAFIERMQQEVHDVFHEKIFFLEEVARP